LDIRPLTININWKIVFNTVPEEKMVISLQASDQNHFFFSMADGFTPSTRTYDQQMKTSVNILEAQNIANLEKYAIKSMNINGTTLPGPYPPPQDFKKLFDSGIQKFPNSTWYNPHRNIRIKDDVTPAPNGGGY